ncbi:hypothetical protein [Streptomyces sp. NPDC088746]|uniref:hypothetical protein n=1 Tax=Streptomyces sp. NPDC088746 TaxID=3365885 RepID=UPI0037F2C6D7
MNHLAEHPSPLISDHDLAAHGMRRDPAAHTEKELAALVALLLQRRRPRTETVAVGHSRDAASRAAADAFATARKARGGTVLTTVDRPETAASWPRPATRPASGPQDAWVMAAALPGFAQLARRLRRSTDWGPARTYAFAWGVRGRWLTSSPAGRVPS